MLCAVAPKENSKKKSSKVMKRKEKLKNCKKEKLHFADVGTGVTWKVDLKAESNV